MKAVRLGVTVAAVLLLTAGAVWAADEAGGVKPETTALYQKAREQVAKLAAAPEARYAPEVIKQATAQIAAAQAGLEQGNERITRQSSELATMQVKLATALTEQRIAAEKTAAAKHELTQLEQRLGAILAGKGEKP